MAGRRRGVWPSELVRGRERFAAWRQGRRPKSRIPDALWELAVRLATAHGLHPTAKALKLDYYSLKKRLAATHASRENDATVAACSASSSPTSPRGANDPVAGPRRAIGRSSNRPGEQGAKTTTSRANDAATNTGDAIGKSSGAPRANGAPADPRRAIGSSSNRPGEQGTTTTSSRANDAAGSARGVPFAATFVELPPLVPAGPECVIECEDGRVRLRVQLRGYTAAEVAVVGRGLQGSS